VVEVLVVELVVEVVRPAAAAVSGRAHQASSSIPYPARR
jgi:hypothetical protein